MRQVHAWMLAAPSAPRRMCPRRASLVALVLCALALTAVAGAAAQDAPRPGPDGSHPIGYFTPAARVASATWPPAPQPRFEHLSPAEGLSQSVVTSMAQDAAGFLWLATQDGLDRFDGAEVRVFRRDPQDPDSLSSNFLNALLVDRRGRLWIGTNGGGLDLLLPDGERFAHYLSDPGDPASLTSNVINFLAEAPYGRLWVGTDQGLSLFDPESGRSVRYRPDPEDAHSLGGLNVSYLHITPDGTLWVGTFDGGLSRLDSGSDRFIRYRNDPEDTASLSEDSVACVTADADGRLWIGTSTQGLDRLDPATGIFEHFAADPSDAEALSHPAVFEVLIDRSGTVWVGTNGGGLNRFDRQTGTFTRFVHHPADNQGLASDSIWSVFEDRAGVLWFGTFGAGADRYDPLGQKFGLMESATDASSGLNSGQIWAILEDTQGVLWIGTNGGGLNRFDRRTNAWRYLTADPANPRAIQSDFVMALFEDSRGTLWVGTFDGGVTRLDRRSLDGTTLDAPGFVVDFLEDRQGVLWMATSAGLARVNASGDGLEVFTGTPEDPNTFADNVLLVLMEDSRDRMWAGSMSGGLALFDRASGGVTRYQHDPENPASLSDNAVLAILEDSQGRLWIGTTGGLNQFDPQTGTFVHFAEKDGLPNDTIYGILEDGQGRLWMTTNRGLSRFDTETRTFRNYSVRDGLQGEEFNQGAYFEDRAGLMYFGGLNGLNVFDPQAITDNPYVMPIVLTGLDLFNRPVPLDETGPLSAPIDRIRSLTLTYRDDFFGFHFAGLHFSAPETHQYAYQLEGLDPVWNEVGARRIASYTNVPPGTYTFRVRGANRDGVWNDAGVSLEVIVTPPFWETWWFRALAALLVVGGAVGSVAWRVRSIQAQNRRLEEQVAQRTGELSGALEELRRSKDAAEAANRAKSVFLANMSHEFRTPLNAILGFGQLMLRSPSGRQSNEPALSEDQRENLQVIVRSGEHLLGLINDVLEMSKIEAGRTTLNEQGFDLFRMLDGLEEMFKLRASQKRLHLSVDRAPDVPQYVRADEGKLRQILLNLLGNAVKFTEQGGVVLRVLRAAAAEPKADPSDITLRFEVEDTGPGVSPEEQARLFQPFVQSDAGQRAQEGTGLGLAISRQFARLMAGELTLASRPGEGSTFSLTLPVRGLEAGEVRSALPARRVIGIEKGQPTCRVLVVDDKEVNRKLLLKVLVPLGFEVREAGNGQEAVELWESWDPQVILMDMRMPVMDGYEATRRIKATTRGQATVIVAVTASALEEERAVILSEGCDAYMRKPFREDELFDTLTRHLGVRFQYDRWPESPAHAASASDNRQAVRQRMAQLPPELLSRLEQATVLGDLQRIETVLVQVREVDSGLADYLVGLASRFEHEEVLALVRAAGGAHEP